MTGKPKQPTRLEKIQADLAKSRARYGERPELLRVRVVQDSISEDEIKAPLPSDPDPPQA
jgi:hypothetical protein